MRETKGAGNQQASESNQIELAWLCGILDGEGSITISRRQKPNRPLSYVPSITIVTNTNRRLIEKCADILSKNGFPYYVWWGKQRGTSGFRKEPRMGKYLPCGRVLISGFKRCYRILPILLPYIHGKVDQAHLMWDWLNYRKEITNFQPGKPPNGESTYGSEDEAYHAKMRELNGFRGPNDYKGSPYRKG